MSIFHKCEICGVRMFTQDALHFHIAYCHRATSVPPRRCLICEGPTHGADAFCGDCQAIPEDDRNTAVKHLVEIGEITDWDTRSWSHVEHMTDEREGKSGNWRAQLVSILSEHNIMLDDSGRE